MANNISFNGIDSNEINLPDFQNKWELVYSVNNWTSSVTTSRKVENKQFTLNKLYKELYCVAKVKGTRDGSIGSVITYCLDREASRPEDSALVLFETSYMSNVEKTYFSHYTTNYCTNSNQVDILYFDSPVTSGSQHRILYVNCLGS